jgi:hypothetical protein
MPTVVERQTLEFRKKRFS